MTHIALCFALLAAGPVQMRVEYHQRLDNALRMPVVYSPDGSELLYFTGAEATDAQGRKRTAYSYYLAASDGAKQRKLFETPVDWDDYLNTVTNSSFAADGQRIAVATTDSGASLRDEEPGKPVPGICDRDGKVQTVACELGSTSGFGFAGDEFVWLDTPGINLGEGYKLKILRDGKPKTLDESKLLAATSLRISPDGKQAMFFVAEQIHSTKMRVRMIDLKTGEAIESPEFHSQDATFDGRPQLFWDAASKGFFCHVSTHAESKWPFELTHYDPRSRKGFVAAPTRNIGASCVLDDRHVAVWQPDGHGCSVIDVTNRDQYSLPENNYILGGRGRRVVVADLERDAIYCADIELLQPGEPPAPSEEAEELE